jgi:hypothetical protein
LFFALLYGASQLMFDHDVKKGEPHDSLMLAKTDSATIHEFAAEERPLGLATDLADYA